MPLKGSGVLREDEGPYIVVWGAGDALRRPVRDLERTAVYRL